MSAKVFHKKNISMIKIIKHDDKYHVIVNRDCLVSSDLHYNKK